ncbi:RICIN domain-containing protein [Streptomyces sp. NPDC058525]|uniref:RICIN domain-containing protein n=1 Tax=Streptomyces sp. NPDC058525 TaxID=3346538 RepID=UPI0036495FBF
MKRAGRLPGPLKGRTAEANALAQFLRELTAELTVSRLEEQYRLSRSVWSEYRSGLKVIPMARLTQVVEDRFARDARARGEQLLKARRLHAAAVASIAALEPAASAAPIPAGVADGSPESALGAGPESGSVADPEASAGAGSSPEPAVDPVVERDVKPDVPPHAKPDVEPSSESEPAAPTRRAERFRRWRTPAQWAALAVLVAVLVVANEADRAEGKADLAAPSELEPGQVQDGEPSIGPEPTPSGPVTPEPSPEPSASQEPTREPTREPAAPPAAPPVTPSAPRPSATTVQGVPVGVPVRIVNRNSGMCLAVPGASTGIIALNQFGCGNFPDHFWRLEPWERGAGPLYRIVNDNSGFCAAVPAADKASGVIVNQYPCGDHPDHLWRLDRDGADEAGQALYRIVNDNSGLCLTVAGADTRQAAAVVQAPCGSMPERQWRLAAR